MSIKNTIINNRIKHEVHTSSEGKGITKTKPPTETVPPPNIQNKTKTEPSTKTKPSTETVPPPSIQNKTKTEPSTKTVPPSPSPTPPKVKTPTPSSQKPFDYQKLLKSIDLMYYAKNMYDIYNKATAIQGNCNSTQLKLLKDFVQKVSELEIGITKTNKPGTKLGKNYADLKLTTPFSDHPYRTDDTKCDTVQNFTKLKLADYKKVAELEYQKAISLLHEADSSLKAQEAIQEYCKQSKESNTTATNAYKEFCEETPDINALTSWVES